MSTNRSGGSLARVNQFLVGDSSAVFTLHHWSAPASNASVAPLRRDTEFRVGESNVQPHSTRRKRQAVVTNARARQVLIKLQESALNFLIRWFLLEEAPQTDHAQTGKRPRCEPGHRRVTAGSLQLESNHNLRIDRFGILIRDFGELPEDKRKISFILRCFYWRWFTWVNVVELLLFFLLVGFCAYQCSELLDEYYSYPTHITITNVINDNFKADLPGLTVCSNNRLSKKTIRRNFPHLNITHFLAISQGSFQSVNNFSVKDQKASTLASGPHWQLDDWRQNSENELSPDIAPPGQTGSQQTLQEEKVISSSSISDRDIEWPLVLKYLTQNKPARLFDVMPSGSIVDSLVCANINGDQIDCSELARVVSIQEFAKCETLFFETALWDSHDPRVKTLEQNVARHPTLLDFQSGRYERQEYLDFDEEVERREGLEEELYERQHEDRVRVEMGNREVVRLRLRFGAEDYANPRQLVGGRITVHSGSMIGVISHKEYRLEPGNWYTFYIYRNDYSRLPPPYNTRCYDYDSNRQRWRERANWLRDSREQIYQLIRRQANTKVPILEYAQALRVRSMGKVS